MPSRFDNLNPSDPIGKRMDMWLTTCECGDDKAYCTYCEILWDARERIEVLESICCGRAFDEGMVKYNHVDYSSPGTIDLGFISSEVAGSVGQAVGETVGH